MPWSPGTSATASEVDDDPTYEDEPTDSTHNTEDEAGCGYFRRLCCPFSAGSCPLKEARHDNKRRAWQHGNRCE
jgi:hypothetical protein